MWTENTKAISEVNTILKQMSSESQSKIPKEMREELEKNATENTDYIKPEIPLDKLKLEEETKEILAVISYNYFCNEEEKVAWNKELEENEQKYQQELREKYNPDNLFKEPEQKVQANNQTAETSEESNVKNQKALVEYRESFFKKILKRIRNFLINKNS